MRRGSMKKRILPLALALVMLLAFLPPYAHAEGGFADVEDAAVARNTEVLRLLGVVSGDDTGLFRPKGNLTRAEFCKMAIELQGLGSKSALYSSRTIFPDVRAEHWASGYINLSTVAGKEQPALMHGFPDGTFRPEQNISYGEAVTVLMRMLGYEDKDTSGIWPRGYFDIAAASGVTKGMNRSEEGGLLREQAAKLFVNALAVEKKSGGTLFTLGKETTLLSIDIVKGVMRTADGEETMAKPMASTLLNGLKGRVVYNSDKKALTFLPS
ncbi:MAG: S-layer homology domain-containing protein, partial [Ruminococcaceae bacterium]|nr:S-layer homology domain-containing protein [Oscillospiraceae bacterium]